MQNDKIVWEAAEYEHRERSRDWFFVLWIIVVSLLVVAILFKNFLFAGIILLSAFSITLHARKEPSVLHFEINRVGVNTHRTFFPYSYITAFWIDHIGPSPKLLLVSSRLFMPMIVIPLGDQDPDEVRNFISNYVTERELLEPLSHKILEYFGF